jgi:hypothetical protein
MTVFQKFVLAVSAAFVALRVFFPAQYESRYGPLTDLRTTLLHVVGILVLGAAGFFLAPSFKFRGFWTTRRRVVVVVVLAAALSVGAVVGFKNWQHNLEESRHRVVEGRSIGNITLGMSLGDVQRRLGPFSSASQEQSGVARYSWNGIEGYWSVFFDAATGRAIALRYQPKEADDKTASETQQRLMLATTRGAHYHHDTETIQVLHGTKPKVYELRLPKGFQLDRPQFSYYYPEVRTEFLFVCIYEPKAAGALCFSHELDNVTVYADGWPPERLWGSSYILKKE